MLDNSVQSIASIDNHLSEQGHFCLIDWLLAHNHLHYPDYEAWRYGQLDNLTHKLTLDQEALTSLLAATTTHCDALGLCHEPQRFYRWDDQHQIELLASKNPHQHEQLTQRWLRPQDLPQLDLFMDNTALITENQLRDALSGRQFDRAQTLLQQLLDLNPTHQRLGAYQDLINYGQHMLDNHTIHADALEAEQQGLQQEVRPLALDVLATQARDYLAFGWRRLADNLQDTPFNPNKPPLHRSYALAQIPDWPAVTQCLEDNPTLYQHPQLLERLATAYETLQESSKAQLLWCVIMEQHSEYGEDAIEGLRDHAIYQRWEDFCEVEDVWPNDYFSAFVLASKPALIHHLDAFPPLQFQSSQAMIALLKCHLSGEDEIAAREQVQAVSPTLLRMYLTLRQR